MESSLGNKENSLYWQTQADNLKKQAMLDYRNGGLWFPEESRFINRIDYRDPSEWGHKSHQWNSVTRTEKPAIRTELALYQNVIAIWFGLLDDPESIKAFYDNIGMNEYENRFGIITDYNGVEYPANSDTPIREYLSKKGRDVCLEHLSWDGICKQWVDVLDSTDTSDNKEYPVFQLPKQVNLQDLLDKEKDRVVLDIWMKAEQYCGYGYGSDTLDVLSAYIHENYGISEAPPAEREASGSPLEGGSKLGKPL